jgi:hypothetical protein
MGGIAIAGFGMGGIVNTGAPPAAGAAAGGGALAGVRKVLVEIMRVNSPGPESTGGGGGAAAPDVSTIGGAFVPSDSLWINRVTLPASGPDGAAGGAAVYDGRGAEEYEGVAAGE